MLMLQLPSRTSDRTGNLHIECRIYLLNDSTKQDGKGVAFAVALDDAANLHGPLRSTDRRFGRTTLSVRGGSDATRADLIHLHKLADGEKPVSYDGSADIINGADAGDTVFRRDC